MTSDPPGNGDPQRWREDEGQPRGGTPQQPDPDRQPPYPQNPQNPQYPQYPPYPQGPGQGGGYPPPGYPQQPPPGGNPPYPPYPPPGGGYGYPGSFPDPSDPLVATAFDQWLSKSLGVVARSWQPLLLILLASYVPAVVLVALLALLGGLTGSIALVAVLGIVSVFVFIAGLLIAQGVSIYYVAHDAAGRPVSLAEAFRFGASRAPALFGWGMLAALMIFVGILLLILPGIYLGLVFTAALTGVIMFERAAIDRCFALYNRRFWPTTGRLLLYGVVAFVYQGIIQVAVDSTLGAESPLGQIVVQLLAIPVALVAVGVSVVTYAELRHHEAPGQVSTPRLVAELQY